MQQKSVKGERIGAAVIDYVIYNIVTTIASAASLLFIDFEDFINSAFGVGSTGFSSEFITFTIILSVVGLVLGIVLYVVIPYKNDGKTLGKSLVRIKAVTDEFGENPSLKTHFVRAIMLWGAYIQTPLAVLGYFSFWGFTIINSLVSIGIFVVILVSFIMILSNERGLHDLIAGTRVVATNFNPNQDFVEASTRVKDWAHVETDDEADNFDLDPDEYKENSKKKDDDFDW